MQLKIKKLNPEAKLPKFGYSDDAGMDLFSVEDIAIISGEKAEVRTGVAVEIPNGYAGLLWDKSSVANKNIHVVAGVFDAGFRGEYRVLMVNLGRENIEIKKGQKIAQVLIQKIEHPEIVEVDELSESERGLGRLGSTGEF